MQSMKHRLLRLPSFTVFMALLLASPAAAAAVPAPSGSETAPPAAGVSRQERGPGPRRGQPTTRLFQVAMVLARTQGEMTYAGLPKNAQKALEDLRDFLPYRGYELLDTVLLRTARAAETSIRGPQGRDLTVKLSFEERTGEEGPEIFVHSFDVTDRTPSPTRNLKVGGPDGFEHEETYAPRAPKGIISTSFGMSVGETLVVGSSRLNGGETALVLLVTAVP